jgi:hypothetical protein
MFVPPAGTAITRTASNPAGLLWPFDPANWLGRPAPFSRTQCGEFARRQPVAIAGTREGEGDSRHCGFKPPQIREISTCRVLNDLRVRA